MKAWNAAWVLIALLICGGCGISGGGSGGNVPKTDDDLGIENVEITALTDSLAVLRWSTTQRAVSTLFYGQESSLLAYTEASALGTRHEVMLEPLTEDTVYFYQILATDGFGKSATTETAQFRTEVSPDRSDLTPPVIRNLRATGVTASAATLVWETDDRSTGRVFYRLLGDVVTQEAVTAQGSFLRNHALVLSGLEQTETYEAWVAATNRANLTGTSAPIQFTTAAHPTLYLWPETIHRSVGEEFDLEVRIRDAVNVAGLSFTINYPATALQVVRIRSAEYFDNGGHVFLVPDTDYYPITGDFSWLIDYENGAAVGARSGSSGTVARVRVRAIGSAESRPISFQLLPAEGGTYDFENEDNGTRLLDHNRHPMRLNVRNATLVIN